MTEFTGLVPKQHTPQTTIQHSGSGEWVKRIVIVGGIGAGLYLVYYLLSNRKKEHKLHV